MKILIVEDNKNFRRILSDQLLGEGFEVDQSDNGLKALEQLERDDYDVMLLDLNLPGLGGMDVLKRLKTMAIPTEVVVITGHGSVPAAVEAMRLGAHDFLTKPFDVEELKAVINKAFERKELLSQNLQLKTQIKRQSEAQKFITKNPRMLEILGGIKSFGLSDFPVLIYGESGVGKELIAKAIHDSSGKAGGPFIPINCGAIPENILESELFGYEKGAFTGAYARKPGLLEIANQGTIFLDEIGELPLQLQVKLLRVIETGKFFRVGGTKDTRVDVKFISATNKDIKREVEKGNFRDDLYYRISTLVLEIPPLRERKEDIPLLIENLVRNNPGFKGKRFSPEALKILSGYSWPGNVRELQNIVHRTLLLTPNDVIERNDLPADLGRHRKISGKRLEGVEKEHILNVLRDVGNQKGKAAEILGLDPKTLYRKLMRYGIKE